MTAKSKPAVNAVAPKWDKRDVTSLLQPYSESPRVFHQLDLGRIAVAVYLTGRLHGSVFLSREHSLAHSNLEMYTVRLGSPDGVTVGYMFRTPLAVKIDPYFLVFFRRGTSAVDHIIKAPKPVEKKYVFSDLIVHANDVGYLITRLENNSVTRMLAGE